MKIFLLIAVISCCFSACRKAHILSTIGTNSSFPWTDSSKSHPKSAAFKGLIEKYNQKGLPGISLLVRDVHGTWLGSVGKADLERNIDFTIGQISKIASVSKFIIGTMVFKMFEDSIHTGMGYTALHKPIKTWLPSTITNRLANGNIATLVQLMNHESGIPDLIEENKFYLQALNSPNKYWSSAELVTFAYDKPPLFKPGDTAVYSNTNIILITLIVEYATGQKHSDLIRKYVFNPLGMNDTHYFPYEKISRNVAQGYYDLYNNNTIVNVSNIATGGMYSNLFDLYKFLDAMLLKKNFLLPKSISIMEFWGLKSDFPNIYGYGIMKKFIYRPEAEWGIGHSGRDLGYTANLFYFPHKSVSHIFLINYGSDGDSRLRNVFKQFQEDLLDLTLH